MADPGWVEMTHPTLGQDQKPAVVTEVAFEGKWKPKGWQKVGEPQARAGRASTEGDK